MQSDGTMTEPAPPPVLIVGAGLAGLVAALMLVKNGIPVRIIEKSVEHRKGQRGAGITPRSLEMYHFLGVDEIEARMCPLPPVRTYQRGGVEPMETLSMFPDSKTTPSRPYMAYTVLGQDIMEGILREHLHKHGVDIEMGTELRSLKQDAEGKYVDVELVKTCGVDKVEERTSVEWLIGADGARGAVRKHLDVTFLGETRNEAGLLVGDFRISGLDGDHWHMWGTMGSNFLGLIAIFESVGLRATTDLGPNGFVLFCSGKGIDAKKFSVDHGALFDWLRSVMERDDVVFEEVYWVSEFRPNIRMANTFRRERVFITGGELHQLLYALNEWENKLGNKMQRMCTVLQEGSVQDSFNLAWKLSLVIKGLSLVSLLDTYSEERVPVIAQMLKFTTHLLDKNVEADRIAQAKSWRRGEETYMLGVNYRGSRILVDEFHESRTARISSYGDSDEVLRAGDRAPDSPGLRTIGSNAAPTRLFDIFKPVRHTILVFTDHEGYALPVVRAFRGFPAPIFRTVVVRPAKSKAVVGVGANMDVVDSEGHAYRCYGAEKTSRTVIVRPDGVVGAIVAGIEGVKRYLGLILTEDALRYLH